MTISGSLFENNQASDGGAIYVEAIKHSIEIKDSQFKSNKALMYGDNIFIEQNSATDDSHVSLSNLQFDTPNANN
jgi:hypothetical protein